MFSPPQKLSEKNHNSPSCTTAGEQPLSVIMKFKPKLSSTGDDIAGSKCSAGPTTLPDKGLKKTTAALDLKADPSNVSSLLNI